MSDEPLCVVCRLPVSAADRARPPFDVEALLLADGKVMHDHCLREDEQIAACERLVNELEQFIRSCFRQAVAADRELTKERKRLRRLYELQETVRAPASEVESLDQDGGD